jgi:hypothetical protein
MEDEWYAYGILVWKSRRKGPALEAKYQTVDNIKMDIR